MDLQAAFHWIYVIAMAIGAMHFITLGNNPRGVPKYDRTYALTEVSMSEVKQQAVWRGVPR